MDLSRFDKFLPGAPKFKDATDFPEIYAKTYWGRFPREGVDPAVVERRNSFIGDHHISGVVQCPRYVEPTYGTLPYNWDDHRETYKCRGGYLLVVSPFKSDDDAAPEDWTEIPTIYTPATRTVIRFVPGRGKRDTDDRARHPPPPYPPPAK